MHPCIITETKLILTLEFILLLTAVSMNLQIQLKKETERREAVETLNAKLIKQIEEMQREIQDIRQANQEYEKKIAEDCTKCRELNIIEPLLFWIDRGDNERFKSFLENPSCFHAIDQSVKSALLHHAVQFSNQNIIQFLLDKGVNVDSQDSTGRTPLMLAVTKMNEAIIELLLNAGADILMTNTEKKSALHMFCAEHYFSATIRKIFLQKLQTKCSSSEETAEILIDAGCYLYQAGFLNEKTIIECMLKRGSFSVDSMHPSDRAILLHFAVLYEDVECIKLLLKYGADPKLRDVQGVTSLNLLYQCGPEQSAEKIEILQILLNHGVPPTSCTLMGTFQIQPTLLKGNRQAIRVLLESDLDFTARDNVNEMCVLHYLAMNSNPGVVEELKLYNKRYNVNILDKRGTSPLHWAAKYANIDMVAFLLTEGAEVNVAHSIHGFTPLYNAYEKIITHVEQQYHQCIELLLQHDADPQFIATSNDGEQITIFEVAGEDYNSLKLAIAYLAILEGLGKSMNEVTQHKISLHRQLKKYSKRSRRLLQRKIVGTITLFKLLTVDKMKMAKYLNNKKLVFKLERISFKQKLRSSYSYYYNTLKKRCVEGIHYNTLKNRAAEVICNISKINLNKEHLILDKIISYLDDQSLESLSLIKVSCIQSGHLRNTDTHLDLKYTKENRQNSKFWFK